jgi:hypothetical protein
MRGDGDERQSRRRRRMLVNDDGIGRCGLCSVARARIAEAGGWLRIKGLIVFVLVGLERK